MGAIWGGPTPRHAQRHPAMSATNMQLEAAFWILTAQVTELFDVHGKEKVYGSIP
jgi:hypothetical protein